MKIGIYAAGAFRNEASLDTVSGHVQVPVKTADILAQAGHHVTLLTTRAHTQDLLPPALTENVTVSELMHHSRTWPDKGPMPLKTLAHAVQLRARLGSERFDVVHFFGGSSVALLLASQRLAGLRARLLYTPILGPPERFRRGMRTLLRRIDRVVPMTEFTRSSWNGLLGRDDSAIARPGVVKELRGGSAGPKRDIVLFWRNAGYENGADLAIAAFAELSPRHPHVRFVFAVRPHDRFESEMRLAASHHRNVELYVHPYGGDVSLDSLIASTLFCVHPFRKLSINPQMAIIETLYAGVPVIASDVESNAEIVDHSRAGLLIKPDSLTSLVETAERLLTDENLRQSLSSNAQRSAYERWNWRSYESAILEILNDLNPVRS